VCSALPLSYTRLRFIGSCRSFSDLPIVLDKQPVAIFASDPDERSSRGWRGTSDQLLFDVDLISLSWPMSPAISDLGQICTLDLSDVQIIELRSIYGQVGAPLLRVSVAIELTNDYHSSPTISSHLLVNHYHTQEKMTMKRTAAMLTNDQGVQSPATVLA
jgi:hypothetical protein